MEENNTLFPLCKNCNEPVHGNYCANCGDPIKLKRIDKQYIMNDISDFFLTHKGLFYTVKKVFITPGKSIRQFIAEDRHRFVKPITFVIITSLFYAIINHIFSIGAEDYYDPSKLESESTPALLMKWILIDYPGYSNLLIGLFMAFWIKIFFKKAGYNIFEIFVLMCFITGVGTLYMSLAAIIQGFIHVKILQIASYIGIIYYTWAIGQFFDKKKIASYLKGFLSYIFGTLVLGFLIGLVGTIIDMI